MIPRESRVRHVTSGRGVRDVTRRRRGEIIVVVVGVEYYYIVIMIIGGKPGLGIRFCLLSIYRIINIPMGIMTILIKKSLMLTSSKPSLFPREELWPANPVYCCCSYSLGKKWQFLHVNDFQMSFFEHLSSGSVWNLTWLVHGCFDGSLNYMKFVGKCVFGAQEGVV